MGFLNKYPYTDFHELNLDYILEILKTVETTLTDFVSLNAIKYADPIQWSITRQYEKNTVVIDPLTGTAYISVAPVPIGAALTRTEYWTVVFDLESFVTKASENFANTYEAQTTTTATQATPQYGWIVWGGLLYVANTNITPGDAYVVDGNITRITVEDIVGHIQTLNTTDKSNLVAAVNEVLATLISTAGDLNSLTTTDKSNLVAAINEVITTFDTAVLDIQTNMGDLATLATTDKTSLVNAINEVLSDLASAISTIDGVTGDLANLTTTDKTSLVNAINEVLSDLVSAVSTIDGVTGDLANLTTTDKTSLVNAINEVLSDLTSAVSTIDGVTGDLANLTTTDKTNLVNAINELVSDFDGYAGFFVTPQMFGALGDGVNDDTSAIQAAINSGHNVYIPEGEYIVSSTLVFPNDQQVTIEGAGSRRTLLRYTGGADSILFDVRGTLSNRKWLKLHDVFMLGTGSQIAVSGEYNSDGLFLDDVHIDSFKIGVQGNHQWNHSYSNVQAVNCTTAFDFQNSNAINFNNVITSGSVTGIKLNTCRDIVVNGGDVSGINGATSTGIDAYYVDGLSIISVYTEYSDTAYKLSSCTGVSITGCLVFVFDSNAKPIDVSSCGAVQIAGNKILAVNSPSNVRAIGIKDSTSVTIESNSIIDVETGIYLYNARYIIGSNVFTGTTSPIVIYDHAYARGSINMLLTDYRNSTVPAAPIPYNQFHFEDVPNFVADLDDLPVDVPDTPLLPYGYCIVAYVGGVMKPVYRAYGKWVYSDGTDAHTDA